MSALFVALLKHLGSDCDTTGSGRASLVFRSGDDVVRVLVEVVKPGEHPWEFRRDPAIEITHLGPVGAPPC